MYAVALHTDMQYDCNSYAVREVEEGQTVAAGFETPTLFTIAKDLTEMQVVADVDEADIGFIVTELCKFQ